MNPALRADRSISKSVHQLMSTARSKLALSEVIRAATLTGKMEELSEEAPPVAADGGESGDAPILGALTSNSSSPTQDVESSLGGNRAAKVLMRKILNQSEELEDLSTCTLLRCWQLKWFITYVFSLRMIYGHRCFSICTRFDPRAPRALRVTTISIILFVDMFIVRSVVRGGMVRGSE